MNNYLCTISIGNSNKSLSIEEYQGKYSIVSTWEGREGSVKPNWCFRQERVDNENVPGKAIPLKLLLGDKAAAVSTLLQMVAALGGSPPAGKRDQTMTRLPPVDDSQDIPF